MANSSVVGLLKVLLTADTAQFEAGLRRVSGEAEVWSKSLGKIGRQATALGANLTRTLTLPIAAIGGVSLKAASDFEASFAGVRKTVSATEEQFAELSQELRGLSKTIPINVNDINRLAESAGALGVPQQHVAEFVRVMAMVGSTTNLSADQAGTAIARIQNIFGAAGVDTEKLASTIVQLGKSGASTESEIVEMAQRLSGAFHTVGASQADVVALASTLASIGVNAEAGGSAMSRFVLKMNDAVSKGGEKLAEFARVADMPVAKFKELFERDAAGAVVAFVEGLNRLKGEGENVNATIVGLTGNNIILKTALLSLAGAGQLAGEQLVLARQEFASGQVLAQTFAERLKTFEAQLAIFRQKLQDVAITLGLALLPALIKAIDVAAKFMPIVEGLAHGFAALPEPVQTIVIALGGLLAAAGPVIFIFGQLATAAGAIAAFFAPTGLLASGLSFFGISLAGVGTAVAGFGATLVTLATGPIGIVVAAVAALTAVWLIWGDEISAVVQRTWQAVKTWLWDNFEPIIMAVGGLLVSVGEMFSAFGALVGAVAMKVVEYAADVFKGVKNWLWDKLKPVLEPAGKLIEGIAIVFGIVKDKVVGFAKALYEGVKTWLVDRFVGIVDGIRSKIDAVTGFFRSMHDAVVGNSYVPDMVTGIGREFAKLGGLMVTPTASATGEVSGLFGGLQESVTGSLTGLMDDIGRIWSVDGLRRLIADPLGTAIRLAEGLLNDFIGKALGALGSLLGFGGGAGGFVGGAVGGTEAAVFGGAGGAAGGVGAGAILGSLALGGGLIGLLAWALRSKGKPWDVQSGQESAGNFLDPFGGESGLTRYLSDLNVGLEEIAGLLAPLSDSTVLGDRDAFETALQAIADAIRQRGIDISDADFRVPQLSSGGFVQQPTLAMLHANEAVIPLDQMPDFGNGGEMRVQIYLPDGRMTAEYLWPFLAGEVRALRLAY